MMEDLTGEEVARLLKGEHVPRRPSALNKAASPAECGFDGCCNLQWSPNHRYCEAHEAQLKRKGVLRPLRHRKWTAAEEQLVREWYAARNGGKVDLSELESRLGRNRQVICRKARDLGLTDKTRRWMKPRRLYKTDAESRAAIGKSTAQRIKTSGHPRGMLGKKHSPEAIERIRQHSVLFNASVTPEERERMTIKANATKLAKYGTAGPAIFNSSNPYSIAKGGRRADLGNTYFRSSWEANYARYLNWLVAQGVILKWRFESVTFRFDGVTRGTITYTPDFEVTENDGSIVFHEVKGWMDPKSKTRLKRMKKYHPTVSILVIGQKEYSQISKTVSSLIPNWE